MRRIVGVRFKQAGKSYYYDPQDLELQVGDGVIVKTEDGNEYGTVSIPPIEREEDKLPAILKQIVRVATDEDKEREKENTEKEKDAYRIAKEKIAELELPMKLIHAEYTFERNKLLFYFSAEGRVDFRELVRVLASVFRTRIELRQIGVRDEARLLGGIGICGRPLCCSTYLSGFAPVSIKMAKEQNLSLNPTKISGICGRLMCCLNNEEETYEYLNREMPHSGDFAVNIDGEVGVIRSVNILKQTVLVMFEDNDTREMKEYSVEELGVTPRREGVPNDEKVEAFKDELIQKSEEKLKVSMEAAAKVVPDIKPYTDNKSEKIDTDRSKKTEEKQNNKKNNKNKKKDKKQGGFKKEKKSSEKPENIKKNDKKPNKNKNNRNDKKNNQRRNGGYSRGYRGDRKDDSE